MPTVRTPTRFCLKSANGCWKEKMSEAEALVNAHFTCKGPGSRAGTGDGQYGCYQVLGNLHLIFQSDTNAPVENYRRELDLNDAVTHLEFKRGGVNFTREMFVSAPDQVMVLRLTADQPGQISFDARLDRPERFETVADGKNGLLMTGQLDNGVDGKGVRYVARVRVLNQGGEVSVHGNVLTVNQANEVVLLISAATDYQGFAGRQTKDPLAASLERFESKPQRNLTGAASRRTLRIIKNISSAFRFTSNPPMQTEANQPTPKRIELAKEHGGDPGLAALYFNFGRYLLISSSRPGGFPANLQGIWAEEIHTAVDWRLASGHERGDELLAGGSLQSFGFDASRCSR